MDKHKKDRIKGFDRDINSKLNFWVVIEENKSIIAFGQAEINKDDKKKAIIEKIYVLKKHRKKGIASNILKDVENLHFYRQQFLLFDWTQNRVSNQ